MKNKSSLQTGPGSGIAVPIRKSLRFRLTITLILSSLFIGVTMSFFLANVYQNRIDREYRNIVVSLSHIVSHMVEGETVDRYLSTLEKDEEYEQTLEQLRIMAREFDVEYIVISTFTEERETFVFDTDEVEGSRLDLGEYLLNSENEAVMKLLPMFLSGSRIEPYVNHSAEWGVLYKTGEPICRQDGSVAAYVFVSISMDNVLQERNTVFAILGVTLLSIVLISIVTNLYVVRRYVIKPMRVIINDVSAYRPDASGTPKEEPQNRSGDEFEILERAIIEKDILSVHYAEVKRHEEELAAKTDFYRKMSHDLRTPLTRVSTSVQVVMDHPEMADELLTDAQADIMDMSKMISDALDDGESGGDGE